MFTKLLSVFKTIGSKYRELDSYLSKEQFESGLYDIRKGIEKNRDEVLFIRSNSIENIRDTMKLMSRQFNDFVSTKEYKAKEILLLRRFDNY